MTPGTYHARDLGELPDIRLVHGYAPFTLDGLDVTPVAVPHDAREPAQFVFDYDGLRLGVLTDLGSITPHVEATYQGCEDRKSTRLNSSHVATSYAVFGLKRH